ncbi:MAG: molybdopterin dinucleotide binding domain-containing protein, partial [Acidimicrobiales bacterium]
ARPAAGVELPPLPPAGPLPAREPGTLRLVATRSLWDGGTIVAHSPHLAPLHPRPAVGLHPAELARAGLSEGEVVRVSSPRGALELPVVADPRLAEGTAALPVNLPGASATALIDASAPVTDVALDRGGAR